MPEVPKPSDALLNAREVAAMLGVDVNWVERACKRGELPYLRIGRLLRFRPSAIAQWMSEKEERAHA